MGYRIPWIGYANFPKLKYLSIHLYVSEETDFQPLAQLLTSLSSVERLAYCGDGQKGFSPTAWLAGYLQSNPEALPKLAVFDLQAPFSDLIKIMKARPNTRVVVGQSRRQTQPGLDTLVEAEYHARMENVDTSEFPNQDSTWNGWSYVQEEWM